MQVSVAKSASISEGKDVSEGASKGAGEGVGEGAGEGAGVSQQLMWLSSLSR